MMFVAVLLQVASWKDPITVATVVVAIFTVVSVIVSAFMWSATRAQAKISREIFEAAHRPYVGVLKFTGSFSHQGKDLPVLASLYITVKNSGTVPAYELTGNCIVSGYAKEPIRLKTDHARTLLQGIEELIPLSYQLPQDEHLQFTDRVELTFSLILEYQGVAEKTYRYEQEASYNNFEGITVTRVKAT